jgi:hypothetical protein
MRDVMEVLKPKELYAGLIPDVNGTYSSSLLRLYLTKPPPKTILNK